MEESVETMFQKYTDHLKAAADVLTTLIGPAVQYPPAAKARYEALTKLEEAHLWAAHGVGALIQFESSQKQQPAAVGAPAEAPALSVVEGGK